MKEEDRKKDNGWGEGRERERGGGGGKGERERERERETKWERVRKREREREIEILFVGWLLNVPATCECISGTDLHRQFHVLPHWDRSCRSNFPSHPVTVYWHRADQSQRWPHNAWQGSHWSANFKVTGMTRPRKNPAASGIRTRDLPLSRRTP